MLTKICNKCGKKLPFEEFYNNPECLNGIVSTCKRCNALDRSKDCNYPEKMVCKVCGKEKMWYEFSVAKKVNRKWYCKECELEFREKNQDLEKLRRIYDDKYRYRKKEINRNSRIKQYEQNMLVRCKRRALENKWEFNLTVDDIIIPERCPILEFELVKTNKGNIHYNSPSIDRIDNSKGYIKGNIMVISRLANTMKNNATWEQIELFCKNILRYSPNNVEQQNVEI